MRNMARISNWSRIFFFYTTIGWKSIHREPIYVIVTETPKGWEVLSSKDGRIGQTELPKFPNY